MSSRIASVRMKRRPLLAAMAMAPIAGMMARVPAVQAQDPIVVTMVTDTAGLGDQNFNDLAKRGLDRAVDELGVQGEVIESRDAASYIPNLTQAAEQSDLTVGVGFLLTEAITEVANQYSDKKFLLIDSLSDAPNVQGVLFREQEGAFLSGVLAGLMTKSNQARRRRRHQDPAGGPLCRRLRGGRQVDQSRRRGGRRLRRYLL